MSVCFLLIHIRPLSLYFLSYLNQNNVIMSPFLFKSEHCHCISFLIQHSNVIVYPSYLHHNNVILSPFLFTSEHCNCLLFFTSEHCHCVCFLNYIRTLSLCLYPIHARTLSVSFVIYIRTLSLCFLS